ncbi:MAG: diguanylate cyclase [Actinobacteria bacterium]|nr:diguanylate cyclase [Actinomycetota bacterium]
MLPKKEIPRAAGLLAKNLLGKPTGPDEFTLIKKDGSEIFVEISTYPVKIDNVTYVLGIARDITEKRKARQEIIISEEKFRTIFNSANDCILIHDLEGKILEANERACKKMGYKRNEFINKSMFEIVPFEYSNRFDEIIEELSKKNSLLFESMITQKSGKKYPVEISCKLINYNRTSAVLIISRDISERKKIEELIRDLAYKDALTGLPNRVMFGEHFKVIHANAVRNNKKFAIMMIDLDNFKAINDTYGHSIGDKLLKYVSKKFLSVLRKEDIVSRIGGDEFLLLIPEIKSKEGAGKVAEKLLGAFRRQFILLNKSIHITLSIGISIFPDDSEIYDDLLKKADTAMYQVKKEGRNNYRIFS